MSFLKSFQVTVTKWDSVDLASQVTQLFVARVLRVVAWGSGSKIFYANHGTGPSVILCTQTPTAIRALKTNKVGEYLIPVTITKRNDLTVASEVQLLNAQRLYSMRANPAATGTIIRTEEDDIVPVEYVVTDTVATLEALYNIA